MTEIDKVEIWSALGFAHAIRITFANRLSVVLLPLCKTIAGHWQILAYNQATGEIAIQLMSVVLWDQLLNYGRDGLRPKE